MRWSAIRKWTSSSPPSSARRGWQGTWAALEAGKTVAVANKETLVMAGPLVTDLAQRRGAEMLPVDSEHSAIFQAHAGQPRRTRSSASC